MMIDFNIPLKKLSGEAIMEAGKPMCIKDLLANGLVNQRTNSRSMQTYELAGRIYNSETPINITPSEKDIIVEYLESRDNGLTVLAAAQILAIVK